ncbi:MAG: MarR family winged helix-turn-helix transcriptional regulator [Promethearchaeota archaeon]
MDMITSFIEQITYGVENFKYNGKDIGTGMFLIMYIGKNKDCSMKDIINYLNIDVPSTATRKVDKLVHYGFVTRYNSKEDRRLIKLQLTSEGEELYSIFYQSRLKGLNKMLKEFDQTELDIFFRVLERVIQIGGKFRSLHQQGKNLLEDED